MIKNSLLLVLFLCSISQLLSQTLNSNDSSINSYIKYTDYLNILEKKKVDTIVFCITDTSHKAIFFYFFNGILYSTVFGYFDSDRLIIGNINDREITNKNIRNELLKFVKKNTRENRNVQCIHCIIKGEHIGDWRRLDIIVPYKNHEYLLMNRPINMQVDFITKFLMKKERKAGEKFIKIFQMYLKETT